MGELLRRGGGAGRHGERTLLWHFASMDALDHHSGSGAVAVAMAALARSGSHRIAGIEIVLATPRIDPLRSFELPCAVWWASDDRLLKLDSGHRPYIAALLSRVSRAPVWLGGCATRR